MELYHITQRSENAKTGPIPVSTSDRSTCPPSCPYRGRGCYAEVGPLAFFWRRLSKGKVKRALNFEGFVEAIRNLPEGQLWRYAQAGDLPGEGDHVDADKLEQLAQASAHTKGWSYSHKPLSPSNLAAIKRAIELGFTVNASANRPEEVDGLMGLGLPTVTVLPSDFTGKVLRTEKGRRIVVCPATYRDDVTCATCGNGRPRCQRADRDYCIGFPAHGSGRKKADKVVNGEEPGE